MALKASIDPLSLIIADIEVIKKQLIDFDCGCRFPLNPSVFPTNDDTGYWWIFFEENRIEISKRGTPYQPELSNWEVYRKGQLVESMYLEHADTGLDPLKVLECTLWRVTHYPDGTDSRTAITIKNLHGLG